MTGFKKLSTMEKYVTGRVILQFINFKEPFSFNEKDNPKYSVTILIPKDNKAEIDNLKKIINKHWKESGLSDTKNGQFPLKDGETIYNEKIAEGKEMDETIKGFYQFKSTTKFKYKLVTKDPKINFTGEESEIKGYWCRLSINVYAYKSGSNCGVTSFLNAVQAIEPSGIDIPGGSVANDFDIEETSNTDDSTPF